MRGKVPSERKQSSAGPAGEENGRKHFLESSHPSIILPLPSSPRTHLQAVFHPTSLNVSTVGSQ